MLEFIIEKHHTHSTTVLWANDCKRNDEALDFDQCKRFCSTCYSKKNILSNCTLTKI